MPRIITACFKAFFLQLLLAGLAAPLFCGWLMDNQFIAEYLPWLAEPTPFANPFWKTILVGCTLLCLAGLAYGFMTRDATGSKYCVRPAFLLWPIALMLAWAYALYSTGGNYHADTPAWQAARMLSQPPYQLLWMADMRNLLPAEDSAYFPLLQLVFLRSGTDFFANYGFFYQNIFQTWHGIATGLFFQLSLIMGIALAGRRPEEENVLSHTCELTPSGTVVARSVARKRQSGGALVALALFCPAAVLGWRIYAVESSLISPRLSSDLAYVVGGGPSLYLYSPFARQSLLVTPDTPSSLRIAEKYPRLDGATAFYPLYAAAFKAVYTEPPARPGVMNGKDDHRKSWHSAIACTTTRKGYSRLIQGEVDIFFGLEPSVEQKREAEEKSVKLRQIPIGKEAFVFLVHESNPVSGLSRAQIQDIYTRVKTNWKEFGGPDLPIMAYQRPENSGSQTIMRSAVMQEKKLPAPLREELILEMGGIITQVAEFRSEAPSIGYSFRWYATEMKKMYEGPAPIRMADAKKTPGLKLLAVDGVAPTPDRIKDGRYPLTVPFYAVVRDEPPSAETKALLDWLTGPEGQALIMKVGYVPVQ